MTISADLKHTEKPIIPGKTKGEITMAKNKKPKYYQCSKCGRFVKILCSGRYIDDFGYWVDMNVKNVASGVTKGTKKPSYRCYCGACDWWYREPVTAYGLPSPGGWVCGKCHPMPGAVPSGDVIVAGDGKMSSYTEHPDGSTSCRWFPEKTDCSPVSDSLNTENPEPEKLLWWVDVWTKESYVRDVPTAGMPVRAVDKQTAIDEIRERYKNVTVKRCVAQNIPDNTRLNPETPAPETPANPSRSKPAPALVEAGGGGRKGRPRFNIDVNLICDTLKSEKNIKAAAGKLGCSRAYIYKMVPADKVKELIKHE